MEIVDSDERQERIQSDKVAVEHRHTAREQRVIGRTARKGRRFVTRLAASAGIAGRCTPFSNSLAGLARAA